MSAKKRRPNSDLNQDNWQDEVSGGAGNGTETTRFRTADSSVLEQRRIVRAFKSPPATAAPKSNNSNPFSGTKLLNGGAKAPQPTPAPGLENKKQAPVAPAPTQSVNTLEYLQRIRLHIGESHKDLSSLFMLLKKQSGSATTTTTTSPFATASPPAAAAPAFPFQPAPAPPAPAPTAFSFPSPTPAAPTPALAIPAASGDSNDASDTMVDQKQQEGVSFADVAEKGWKRLLTVEQVKVFQLKAKKYKSLGVGTLKLQQDETDPTKYALRCGTPVNSGGLLNCFLTGKANPKWGEEAKPGAKFRTLALTLNDEEGKAQVYRLKAASADASSILTCLQETVKTLPK